MAKVSVEIKPEQITSVIEQLSDGEKWKIAKDIVEKQFKVVINKFRDTVKEKGFTYRKINSIVDKTREEFYAKSRCRY